MLKPILFFIFAIILSFCESIRHPSTHQKHSKSHKSHKNIYGVSLSSITGFEKPMVPPRIINYDLPVNHLEYEFGLELPSRTLTTFDSTALNETHLVHSTNGYII